MAKPSATAVLACEPDATASECRHCSSLYFAPFNTPDYATRRLPDHFVVLMLVSLSGLLMLQLRRRYDWLPAYFRFGAGQKDAGFTSR